MHRPCPEPHAASRSIIPHPAASARQISITHADFRPYKRPTLRSRRLFRPARQGEKKSLGPRRSPPEEYEVKKRATSHGTRITSSTAKLAKNAKKTRPRDEEAWLAQRRRDAGGAFTRATRDEIRATALATGNCQPLLIRRFRRLTQIQKSEKTERRSRFVYRLMPDATDSEIRMRPRNPAQEENGRHVSNSCAEQGGPHDPSAHVFADTWKKYLTPSRSPN